MPQSSIPLSNQNDHDDHEEVEEHDDPGGLKNGPPGTDDKGFQDVLTNVLCFLQLDQPFAVTKQKVFRSL